MTVIKIKSDTTVNLTGTTPAEREILHDSTTNSLYLGDGTTTFASLTSISGGGGGGGGITSVAQDTTPQLGGDLDAQSNDISSVGTITATSIVKSGGASSEFLKADGSVDTSTYLTDHPTVSAASSSNSNTGNVFIQNLTIDTDGHITGLTTGTATSGGGGGISDVVDDTSPQLGGNLDAQSNEITAVSKLEIANTSTDDSLLITTTEDSATAAPVLTFKRNSSSPDDSDYLGQLKFKGENDADQEVVYAKVTAKISDASDTTEDGIIEFALRKAGSNNIGMRLTSTELKLLNGTSLDMGSQPIENVTDPSSAQEAATKNYVDTISSLSSLSITKSQVSDLNTLTSHRLVDGTYPFPSALDSSSNKALFSDGSSAVEFKTAPKSDISGISGNVSGVYNIVILDQTAYNNITTKDPNTIYFVP